MRHIRASWLAAGLAAFTAVSSTAGEVTDGSGWPPSPEAAAAGPAECTPAPFARAEILGEGETRRLEVTVEGVGSGVEIRLQPYVYVMQPEFWAIGVVACAGGAEAARTPGSVVVALRLAGTIGTRGIEVLGGGGAVRRFELR